MQDGAAVRSLASSLRQDLEKEFLKLCDGLPAGKDHTQYRTHVSQLLEGAEEFAYKKCQLDLQGMLAHFEYTCSVILSHALSLLKYNQTKAAADIMKNQYDLETCRTVVKPDEMSIHTNDLRICITECVRHAVAMGKYKLVGLHQQQAAAEAPRQSYAGVKRRADLPPRAPLSDSAKQVLEACKASAPKACLGYVYHLLDDSSKVLFGPRSVCTGSTCPDGFAHVTVRLPEGLKYRA